MRNVERHAKKKSSLDAAQETGPHVLSSGRESNGPSQIMVVEILKAAAMKKMMAVVVNEPAQVPIEVVKTLIDRAMTVASS